MGNTVSRVKRRYEERGREEDWSKLLQALEGVPTFYLKMWGISDGTVICPSTPPAAPHWRPRLGLCRISRAMLASRG